jgi:hypothetical protein
LRLRLLHAVTATTTAASMVPTHLQPSREIRALPHLGVNQLRGGARCRARARVEVADAGFVHVAHVDDDLQ